MAQENTLAAFDLALLHGCDGFEFDVRCTSDQKGILCHDPAMAGLPIAETAYSVLLDQCQRISREAQTIPCIEDVIQRYNGRAYLDIELKVAGLEKKLVGLLEKFATDHYVVSSFLPEVLQTMHSLQPAIPLGWICDKQQTLARWHELPCTIVIPERKLVTQSLIDEIHSGGKKVFVWTVNQKEEMLQWAGFGADAIISDDTQLLGSVFPHLR